MRRFIAAASIVAALLASSALPAQAARCYTLHIRYDDGTEKTVKVCPGSLPVPVWGLGR